MIQISQIFIEEVLEDKTWKPKTQRCPSGVSQHASRARDPNASGFEVGFDFLAAAEGTPKCVTGQFRIGFLTVPSFVGPESKMAFMAVAPVEGQQLSNLSWMRNQYKSKKRSKKQKRPQMVEQLRFSFWPTAYTAKLVTEAIRSCASTRMVPFGTGANPAVATWHEASTRGTGTSSHVQIGCGWRHQENPWIYFCMFIPMFKFLRRMFKKKKKHLHYINTMVWTQIHTLLHHITASSLKHS